MAVKSPAIQSYGDSVEIALLRRTPASSPWRYIFCAGGSLAYAGYAHSSIEYITSNRTGRRCVYVCMKVQRQCRDSTVEENSMAVKWWLLLSLVVCDHTVFECL